MIRSILFFVALAACAQTYELRGTVSEAGGAGIADVEVTVQRIEDGASKKIKSDGQGAFRVTVDAPGAYVAIASKDGYAGNNPLGVGAFLTIDPARPQAVANITLQRMGEVTGRVLDEETRDPVIGIEITLFRKQWQYGELALNVVGLDVTRTDGDGRFRISKLPPGNYIASARRRASSVEELEDFVKADLEKLDEAFPATYWPGGGEAAAALGVTLTSGGYADVGTMFVRKAPQYRAHVTMQGNCGEGESVQLSLLRRDSSRGSTLGSFPCSGDLLLRGFDPGSYALYASSARGNGNIASMVSGVANIEVIDKNFAVAIPLQRNIVIDGQLTVSDGSTPPRLLPRITSQPFGLIPGAQLPSESAILWAPDQRHFQLPVSPRTQSLIVADPDGAYVKEIRYNGTPLRGSTLPINPGTNTHKLEIVVDDKWGSLGGTVTDGSKGVAASVLMVKDSTRVEDLTLLLTGSRSTGPDGTLPATRIAPGDYRLVAVPSAQAQRIHEAGVLERLLSTAQRVTVSPGGAQTVTIRVSEAR